MFSLAKAYGFLRETVKSLEKLAKASLWKAPGKITSFNAVWWDIQSLEAILRQRREHGNRLSPEKLSLAFKASKTISVSSLGGKGWWRREKKGKGEILRVVLRGTEQGLPVWLGSDS